MKALVLEAVNQLIYKDAPKPAIGDKDILVRVKAACICNGSDPAIVCGATWSDFPAIMGHEAFGEIVEVGAGVTDFKVGDTVCWWFCMGAFAEYARVDTVSTAVFKVEETGNKLELPIMELVVAAYRIFASVDIKDKAVLVVGQGPAGLVISQLCLALGAKSVTAWELKPERKKVSDAIGCRDYDGEFDVVIDAFGDDQSGGNDTLNRAILRTKLYGELVLFGHPIHGRCIDSYLVQSRNLQVKLPTNDMNKIKVMAREVYELYRKGAIDLGILITKVIRFEEIAEQLKDTSDQIKIIIDMEE